MSTIPAWKFVNRRLQRRLFVHFFSARRAYKKNEQAAGRALPRLLVCVPCTAARRPPFVFCLCRAPYAEQEVNSIGMICSASTASTIQTMTEAVPRLTFSSRSCCSLRAA